MQSLPLEDRPGGRPLRQNAQCNDMSFRGRKATVGISRYHWWLLHSVSVDGSRRLPQPLSGLRNDIFVALYDKLSTVNHQ